MEKSPWRRRLLFIAAALAGLGASALLLILALEAGYFRGPFVRYLSHSIGRDIRINGSLRLRLLSRHPSVIAEGVVIGNPHWTPPGVLAEIQKLTVVFGVPFSRDSDLQTLQMEAVNLHLICDADGRANWQRTDPAKGAGGSLPLLRSLTMRDAQVTLDDQRRHLQFQGQASAYSGRPPELPSLHIAGSGQLNGHALQFELQGDPLATVTHDAPYRFTFTERSSGSRLALHGSLPQPLDLNVLEADFEAQGADLNDLHYLVGLNLVNTGEYQLRGKLSRRGSQSVFSELQVRSGQSDVHGSLTSDIENSGRSRLDVHLESQLLRMADLGLQAAGRDPQAASAEQKMFSDAMVNTDVARRIDGVVQYHAARVQLRKLELQSVDGRLAMEQGVLSVPALTGELMKGTWRAKVRMDVNPPTPETHLDLEFADLQLALLPYKRDSDPPPLEGALHGNVTISGRGRSIHQVVASADGVVSARVSAGTIRESLAELAGIDLRGLGLVLTHNQRQTALRCAAAKFTAHAGTLSTQSLIMDTEPVLITGSGTIRLDSESLQLELRGEPKSTRILRLAAPLRVDGTLMQPRVHVEPRDSSLKLFDRGKPKDGECGVADT
jgi:hypothetical protein